MCIGMRIDMYMGMCVDPCIDCTLARGHDSLTEKWLHSGCTVAYSMRTLIGIHSQSPPFHSMLEVGLRSSFNSAFDGALSDTSDRSFNETFDRTSDSTFDRAFNRTFDRIQ